MVEGTPEGKVTWVHKNHIVTLPGRMVVILVSRDGKRGKYGLMSCCGKLQGVWDIPGEKCVHAC